MDRSGTLCYMPVLRRFDGGLRMYFIPALRRFDGGLRMYYIPALTPLGVQGPRDAEGS